MNIKTYDKTIKELLLSGKQFIIPRFQRAYSWDKGNYKEFYEDILNCLTIKNGKVIIDQYFLGTMLFVGDYSENNASKIEVVDGQQRLTSITILFSALSDTFIKIGETVLSEQIFKYIMTTDDDGEEVRILQSNSHYPFFSFFIQDRSKQIKQEPSSEEEECIKDAYKYFFDNLDETKVRNFLKNNFGDKEVDGISYIEILKGIRDQILNTIFVSISTFDKKQANLIFEILNAKGKRLTDIDLIKNKVFEVLDDVEPADVAQEKWKNIKSILNSCQESVGLATFYRHFWISKYKKVSDKKLYNSFNSLVAPKNKERFLAFLNELEHDVKNYIKIIHPTRDDYDNRKEYFGLVQSLNVLTNYFGIIQVRVALLALFEIKEKGLLTLKELKEIVVKLENFHFAYNAIAVLPTNKLESLYSNFAISLRKCVDKEQVRNVIDSLMNEIDKLYPNYQEFEDNFIQLEYSKKENPSNVKTKYALNKINSYYSKTEIFDDESSIEHILSESLGETTLNIGNLIVLEERLNKEANELSFKEKIKIYRQSSYEWIGKFVDEYDDLSESDFQKRAKSLAMLYFSSILGRRCEE